MSDKPLNREVKSESADDVINKVADSTIDKATKVVIDKPLEPVTNKASDKNIEAVDNKSTSAKTENKTSEVETLLKSIKNTSTEAEFAQGKALFSAEQEQILAESKGNSSNDKANIVSEKSVTTSTNNANSQNIIIENTTNENGEVLESNSSNKAAFAGVSVSGEKQAQESNQNHSRVVNQATQKVVEQQAPNMGSSSQEQSANQQSQSTAENIITSEKLQAKEVPVNEKQFAEVFDKKSVTTGIERINNRDAQQVNEATKLSASAEEMITKLAGDTAQSTAQSVTNAKQITSLQNEALSVYRKDFAGSVKDKVMVMMNQKLQQIDIRLDPQELGNVNVKINLQNDQAVVNFTVQNQQAKEAFDQNLGRLKEMLAESGVDVGDANVEQQNKQNGEEQLGDNRHSLGSDDNHEDLAGLSDTQTINLVKGSSSGVDYYA